jgi:trigger factor
LEGALKELQKMQTKEVRATAEEAATKADKAVVDMHMFHDKVALEGGDAHGYQVFLNEPHYIPGFSEQLVGMKEGEEKKFALPFPKDHYQKHLAGKDVDFEVKLTELYHLDHPDLDDAFGASLGFKDLAELKDRLQTNIQDEKTAEENARLERAVLDAVADASRFSEIPELLVNDEVNKMIHEIEHNVGEQGMDFNQYLKSINKTIAQLKIDFAPQAIQRIKVMLILREVAKQQNIMVDPKELDLEIDKVAERYQDKESKDRIYSPMYREYMEGVLRNKKVIDLLKAAIVK